MNMSWKNERGIFIRPPNLGLIRGRADCDYYRVFLFVACFVTHLWYTRNRSAKI